MKVTLIVSSNHGTVPLLLAHLSRKSPYFESQNVYSELGTTVKSMLEGNVKCLKYVETNLVLSWYFQKFDSIGSFSKDEH